MIRALGCVQLDTISVVSRSHETVLWSRLGPYDPALLGALHYPDGLLTEYWAHAAAIIPVETLPYYRDAMDAHREKYERHPWIDSNQEVISGVLERIRADGATASRHFERPDGPRPEAWTWYGGKPARQALDHLWSCGELMVARRESGFQRVYDVTERVIPSDLLSIRPSAEERQRFFTSGALRALGVATARWATDYFRTWARPHSTAKESVVGLKVLQDEGLAVSVTVDGLSEPAWLDAGLLPRLAELRAGRGQTGADNAPLAVRQSHLVPRADGGSVGFPLPHRGLHAGAEAGLWLLHDADPASRQAHRPVGSLARPQEPAPHLAQSLPGTGRAGDGVGGDRDRRGALGFRRLPQRRGGARARGRA